MADDISNRRKIAANTPLWRTSFVDLLSTVFPDWHLKNSHISYSMERLEVEKRDSIQSCSPCDVELRTLKIPQNTAMDDPSTPLKETSPRQPTSDVVF